MKITIEKTKAGLFRATDDGAGLHAAAIDLDILRGRVTRMAEDMAAAAFDAARKDFTPRETDQ